MTAAHEVSAARELIDIAEKRQMRASRALFSFFIFYFYRYKINIYTVTINPSIYTTVKIAMTAAREVSAAREPIGIAEKRQQYFEICDYRCHAFF